MLKGAENTPKVVSFSKRTGIVLILSYFKSVAPIPFEFLMKSKGALKPPSKDQKKEKIYKVLEEILVAAGYIVRREELKRGFGWKVVSGLCRFETSKIIFVDRRMPQEDQVSFLSSKIVSHNIVPGESHLLRLKELNWSLEGALNDPQETASAG